MRSAVSNGGRTIGVVLTPVVRAVVNRTPGAVISELTHCVASEPHRVKCTVGVDDMSRMVIGKKVHRTNVHGKKRPRKKGLSENEEGGKIVHILVNHPESNIFFVCTI